MLQLLIQNPLKIFSVAQLYEADSITEQKQEITKIELMERAGTQIFNWLDQKLNGAPVPIHIFCGIGNNGGDGLVVGRLLIEHGYTVHTYVANFTDKRSKCFLINYDRIKNVSKQWPVLMTSEKDFPEIAKEDIILDALFGIGLNRAPEGWVKDLIIHINKSKAFTLSIDIPSGLAANTPTPDKEAVVKANHTLTFQAPKLSFFLPETGNFARYFEVLDIGLDREYLSETTPIAQLIAKPDAQKFYKPRGKFDHKGTYGHALIVGGSYGKMGAIVLSTKAAFRVGAGLVTAFGPEIGYNILQTSVPEAMVISDKEDDIITDVKYTIKPQAIGIGMGMGIAAETVTALEKLMKEASCPMLLDADAINCLATNKKLLKLLPKQAVLTPHPGELERLLGKWTDDYNKIEKAKAFSEKHEVVLVIKGAHTITIFGKQLYINTTGNPGMATAGSGDALSGMITGLLAQGYDPLLASVFGVYLHGSAGDIVAHQIGFEATMAGDIVDAIGDAYIELFAQPAQEPPK